MTSEAYLTRLTEVNLKWVKELHGRPETVKLLEENRGGKQPDIILGKDFVFLLI